jgi:hypothetical protein
MGEFAAKQFRPAHRASADLTSPTVVQQPGGRGRAGAVPAIVREVLAAPGQPLDMPTRALMGRRFGHDFSGVRVHTDSRAAESARSVLARAYTVGPHVVFGDGEYAPGTHRGRELLGHELTHTLQQGGAARAPLSVVSDTVSERRAESAGRDVANGRDISAGLPAVSSGLARAPIPIDAYPADMLAKELAEVQQRLRNPSYSGRDRDVDEYMALKREADKRAVESARAELAAHLKSAGSPPQAERHGISPKFLPGGFTDQDIDPGRKQRENAEKNRKEQEALDRQREEADRPARLALARRYLTLHGVMRYDVPGVLAQYLTPSDLRLLVKNGLEPPGFFTRHYADKVIDIIDKVVPRDPMEDRENIEDLQRRAAAQTLTMEKMEGVAAEGPHALLGRVVGWTTASLAHRDPLWGSEVGAAFMGMAGVRREMRYGMPSLTGSAAEPSYPDTTHEVLTTPPEQMPAPGPLEPDATDKPDLTFPRGVDVTNRRAFPPRRETLEEYRQRGGVPTKVREGQSGTKPKTPTRLSPSRVTARPTGAPTPSDVDVTSQPGMRRQFQAYPAKPQHHVFPQELRSWFEERFKGTSEDIHDYTLYLSEGVHQATHKAGQGGVVKGVQEADLKGWNQEWKDFKRDYPNASPQLIFEKAGQLMDKYKISGEEIARYKGKK